jgi:peptide deformylase
MRELLKSPDLRLRQRSEEIPEIDDSVKELGQFLISRLGPADAVGLAAPQYGEQVRMIVVRVDTMTDMVIVNPVITKERGEHFVDEGCRSIPGKIFRLKRPKLVKVKGLNLDGKPITIKGHDLLAQILKHEIDHLDGIMIDSIGTLLVRKEVV